MVEESFEICLLRHCGMGQFCNSEVIYSLWLKNFFEIDLLKKKMSRNDQKLEMIYDMNVGEWWTLPQKCGKRKKRIEKKDEQNKTKGPPVLCCVAVTA